MLSWDWGGFEAVNSCTLALGEAGGSKGANFSPGKKDNKYFSFFTPIKVYTFTPPPCAGAKVQQQYIAKNTKSLLAKGSNVQFFFERFDYKTPYLAAMRRKRQLLNVAPKCQQPVPWSDFSA